MNARGEIKLSSFIVGLIAFTLAVIMFASLASEISLQYGISSGNNSIANGNYSHQTKLINLVEDIQNSTDIQQQEGSLDVIGGFFSSGYSALKVAALSFSIFDDITVQAARDVPDLAVIFTLFKTIIIVLIVVGLLLAVLLKMRT